jgi:hypothetical protein
MNKSKNKKNPKTPDEKKEETFCGFKKGFLL